MRYAILLALLVFVVACTADTPTPAPPTDDLTNYAFESETTTTVTFERNSNLGALVVETESAGVVDYSSQTRERQMTLHSSFIGAENSQEIHAFSTETQGHTRRQDGAWRESEPVADILGMVQSGVSGEDLVRLALTFEERQLLALTDMSQATVVSEDIVVDEQDGQIVAVHVDLLIEYEDEVDNLQMVVEHTTRFSQYNTAPTPQRPAGLA